MTRREERESDASRARLHDDVRDREHRGRAVPQQHVRRVRAHAAEQRDEGDDVRGREVRAVRVDAGERHRSVAVHELARAGAPRDEQRQHEDLEPERHARDPDLLFHGLHRGVQLEVLERAARDGR